MYSQLVTLTKQLSNPEFPQNEQRKHSYSKVSSHFLPSPDLARLVSQRNTIVCSACTHQQPDLTWKFSALSRRLDQVISRNTFLN